MTTTKEWTYQPIEYKNQDIEINGYPFYAETITGSEPFTRREFSEKAIMNGTTLVSKGQFIPRQYSFKTSLFISPENLNVHDKILREMVIEPSEVVCPAMGEPFQGIITIKKDYLESTPHSLNLEFTIKEIPEIRTDITESRIYEGAESDISIEEYNDENKKMAELSKGIISTENTGEKDTEILNVNSEELIDNGGDKRENNTADITIRTKN